MRILVGALALASLASCHAFVGSTGKLLLAAPRSGATSVCATSMSQEAKVGRRAALLTTLVTGVTFATKADAGLNLMPPGLKSIKDGVDKKKGVEAGPEAAGGKFELPSMPKIEAPSFTVPKFGAQRKPKEPANDSDNSDKPKKSRQSIFSGKQKAEEAPKVEEAPKPVDNTTSKPRKLKQAGMSGKEADRFKGDEVDSLEQKLLKKRKKIDEQQQEMKAKVGDKVDLQSIPKLNPFARE